MINAQIAPMPTVAEPSMMNSQCQPDKPTKVGLVYISIESLSIKLTVSAVKLEDSRSKKSTKSVANLLRNV